MSTLNVALELPQPILLGLQSGSLKRVGGVIVDSSTNQVVTWLRDGASDFADQSNPLVNSLMSASKFGALRMLTPGMMVLNVALAGMASSALTSRFSQISSQLAELKSEFEADRKVRLEVALQAATDVLGSTNPSFVHSSNAPYLLLDAKKHILREFEQVLSNQPLELDYAQHLLVLAMNIVTLRTRCYLKVDDQQLAREYLRQQVTEFKKYSHKFIDALLGTYPAIYLHSKLADEAVERFLDIQLWLRDIDKSLPNMLSILHELRKDFWNTQADDVFDGSQLHQRVQKLLRRKEHEPEVSPVEKLESALIQAELLIENLDRMRGFELEIRSMRLSTFEEWQNLTDKPEYANQPVAIYDKEHIQRLGIS